MPSAWTAGSETQVNTYTTSDQLYPAVAALAGGGYVVTWQSYNQDGSGWGIYAQRYDADGVAQGSETLINTHTSSDQSYPAVAALAGGGYVVTWESYGQDGSVIGIHAQRYDADGMAQGGETLVNTETINQQSRASVAALADGGYVITWNSYGQDGSGAGIYAQRYDADGVAQGTETQINTTTTDDQLYPAVTALEGGGYVITWMSWGQDGAGYGVYMQRYDADGVAQGTETLVNTETASNQQLPSVAALHGGGFVVTWMSASQDGSGWGIYAQRYDADGVAQGTETQVNTYTTGHQQGPKVTGLADGGFVVTWMSANQDGSGWGIYAQRFDAGGVAQDDETLVNTTTNSTQFYPAVAALEGGGYVVTWASYGQDGSAYGIYSRSFAPPAAPPEITSNGGGSSAAISFGEFDTTVTTVTATDADTAQSGLSYSIAGGADAALFAIDSVTGVLTFINPPSFEAPGDADHDNVYEVQVAVSDGTSTVTQDLSVTVTDVHTFNGTAAGGETITGDADGNDKLDGRGGGDTLIGLGGNDTYYVRHANDVVTEAIGGGTDQVATNVSWVMTAGQEIELLTTFGSATTDHINLTGNEFAQTIVGNAGNNRIDGRGGGDRMHGLGGDDTYLIYHAGDLVFEAIGGGNDLVATSISYALMSGQEIERLTTFGSTTTDDINLTGNAFAQTITGNAGANRIDGRGGGDKMYGMAGDDIYFVRDAADRVYEAVGGGNDQIVAAVSHALLAGQEIEKLATFGSATTDHLNLTGNEFGQAIVGNAGNNVINGKGGNDRLFGMAGADTFVFDTALGPTNIDCIGDFTVAEDIIRLDRKVFTALAAGNLDTSAFTTGTAATTAAHKIIYNAATGALSYDADGAGGAAAVQFALISKNLALTSADFNIV